MNSTIPILEILGTLREIAEGTRQGRVKWVAGNDRVSATFSRARLNLEPSKPSREEWDVSLISTGGETIWSANVSKDDALTAPVRELYELGMNAALKSVLSDIARDLKSSESSASDESITPTSELPHPLARPSQDQAIVFFETIAGRWLLEFPRGQEEIEIDSSGNLFLVRTMRGPDIARDARPRYRLELLSAEPDFSNVEIAKVELTGRVRQIEVLWLARDGNQVIKMKGHAKHDGHSIEYFRKP